MRKVEQCSDEMKTAEKNLDDIWDEMRRDDEVRRAQMNWDEVWSLKCEVWVWSVECEECIVKCEVRRVQCELCSVECEEWRVKCGVSSLWHLEQCTFAQCTHARAALTYGRMQVIDDKGLSYGITLRQFPPSCRYYWYCVFATPILYCETHALVTLKLKYYHVPSRFSFEAWTMRTLFFKEKTYVSGFTVYNTL